MSDAIGPGDWVECVKTWGPPCAVGDVVQVSHVMTGTVCSDLVSDCDFGVRLANAPNPPDPEQYWCGCQFRPIYSPKEGVLRDLMQPIDEREDA